MEFSKIIKNNLKNIYYANGIYFLKSKGIEVSCINFHKNYDEILLNYISNSSHRTEITFLENGLLEIFKGLNELEKIEIPSKESIRQTLFDKYNGKTNEITKDRLPMTDEQFSKYLETKSSHEFNQNNEYKEYANLVLNYEFLQFKIKLSRFGISIIFSGKEIGFINSRNEPNESNELTKKANKIVDVSKNDIIDIIKKHESLANETIKVSIRQDVFELQQRKLDEEHLTILFNTYLTNLINNYHNIKNLYKASNEQFYFLKEETNNSLSEEDRLDFIATAFKSYLDFIPTNNEEIEAKIEANEQFENLDEIVYETKLLELKVEIIKKMIKENSDKNNFDVENKNSSNVADTFEKIQEKENSQNKEIIQNNLIHPSHNPNFWNHNCFELFKYLYDEYYNQGKKTNTKLICIWFFLSELKTDKYKLKISKIDYKIFINEKYKVLVTNSDKPENYYTKVFDTLDEHRINFESNLK